MKEQQLAADEVWDDFLTTKSSLEQKQTGGEEEAQIREQRTSRRKHLLLWKEGRSQSYQHLEWELCREHSQKTKLAYKVWSLMEKQNVQLSWWNQKSSF